MAEFILPGRITAESEFLGGAGACGPASLAAALRWSLQQDSPGVADLVPQLAAWGDCSLSGVSDTPKLRDAARRLGAVIENPANGESILHFAGRALQAVQGAHLGAVVLQLTNGQALTDYLSGTGEDATNLQGHFICLVGYNSGGNSPLLGCSLPPGFFAADGDSTLQNPVVAGLRVHRRLNTALCYYPLSVLQAAAPYDAFSVLQRNQDVVTVLRSQLATATNKLTAISKVLSST